MDARRRTVSYWYARRYTTARHRFTPDRDRTPNPASFLTSPARAHMPDHRRLATPDIHHPAGGAVLVSSLCAGYLTPTSAPTLVLVAVARGRVLCPKSHGENDDMFHFCQWCATPSTCFTISAVEARLSIDEAAPGARYTQFTASLNNETSTVRRKATTTLLG